MGHRLEGNLRVMSVRTTRTAPIEPAQAGGTRHASAPTAAAAYCALARFPHFETCLHRCRALVHSVTHRVVERTGGRLEALVIELAEGELVVRGTAPCYYVKQLALHAALEAIRSANISAGLRLDIDVFPPGSSESNPARLSAVRSRPPQGAKDDLDDG